MGSLLYASTDNDDGKRLYAVLKERAPIKLELYQTLESLVSRLHRPLIDLKIAVLMAPTRKALDDFVQLRDLLRDMRLLLILPDREPGTIAKGHKLRPRLLTYTDSDFSDVATVLNRIHNKENHGFPLPTGRSVSPSGQESNSLRTEDSPTDSRD